jgi:CRISPR-associated protein Csm4
MGMYLYRLFFKGPLHFGLYGVDLEAVEERLSSDSLMSALLNAIKLLEGEEVVKKTIEALQMPIPPFILSSLFPFGPNPKNRSSYSEVLVRPLIDPPVSDKKIFHFHGKELKRIRYLTVEDFRLWIGKENLTELQIGEIIDRSKNYTNGWWYKEIRPRVALDRLSQNSNIWNQAAIWFAKKGKTNEGEDIKGAGLYGLIQLNDEKWSTRIESGFRFLGEVGIGGERTYGLGLFHFGGLEPLPEYWEGLFKQKSRAHIFLSMYYPNDAERQDLKSCLQAWETVERRGYVVSGRNTTTIKRKRVRMFAEGTATSKLLSGCMINVTPDHAVELAIPHRVYRSGLAYLVPGRSE